MDKAQWGKPTWQALHYIALGFPSNPSTQDKVNYQMFYENFYKVIPCTECSKHYQENLKTVPIEKYLANNDTLFEWTVKIHNLVNKLLNKHQLTLAEAKVHYLEKKIDVSFNLYTYLIVIVVMFLLYFLYKRF